MLYLYLHIIYYLLIFLINFGITDSTIVITAAPRSVTTNLKFVSSPVAGTSSNAFSLSTTSVITFSSTIGVGSTVGAAGSTVGSGVTSAVGSGVGACVGS